MPAPATRSQQYAARAYECVSKIGKDDARYRTAAKKLPTLIHTCGLAQAIAFANSKEDYKKNIIHLKAVLSNQQLENDARLADCIRYLRLSREAIMAAGWLKRYAEALLAAGGED